MLKSLASYENPIFKRQTSRDLQGSIQTDFIGQKIEIDDEEEKDFLDEDSFRWDCILGLGRNNIWIIYWSTRPTYSHGR